MVVVVNVYMYVCIYRVCMVKHENIHVHTLLGGHLALLKWARENSCPPWDVETFLNAINNATSKF